MNYSAPESTEDDCLAAVEECLNAARDELNEKLYGDDFAAFLSNLENFGSIIRGYIVAPRLNDSLFMAADWFENYQKRRVSMYTNWKLRGGICCASEARECFDWKNKTKWQEFLVAIAKIRVENEGCCVLSELEEEMKSQLRWSWIQKWMKDGNKTILVGKLFENDPTVGSFHLSSYGKNAGLRHLFRVLYPGEPGDSCKPALMCKKCRSGGRADPPEDGNYAALALDHVLNGSRSGAAGRWISTTASLGVAQRFSGQLFAPVALIYIGDMENADANSKVRNLTFPNSLRSLHEEAGILFEEAQFHRLQIRAKRSQEVLVFGTIPSESVRILTPSLLGGECKVWPYDQECTGRTSGGVPNITEVESELLGRMCRPHGMPSGRQVIPQAFEFIRPLGSPNDGLSLVKIEETLYLLKRAKPNVEDDEMLSAAAMKVQLQACWVANAIHAVVTERCEDFGCCLYEYEAYFQDFKDPAYELFTWPDTEGSISQVWSGVFLLFRWPETLPAAASMKVTHSDIAKSILADCLLGIPPNIASDLQPTAELTMEQVCLIGHVLKLDHALGGLAIERTKRSDGFAQAESLLKFLGVSLEQMDPSNPDTELHAQKLIEEMKRLIHLWYNSNSTDDDNVHLQISKFASLLDLQPFKTELHTKFKSGYKQCLQDRLDKIKQLDMQINQQLPAKSPGSGRTFSQGCDSPSPDTPGSIAISDSREFSERCLSVLSDSSSSHFLNLRDAIRKVLELACNYCAILFAEPLFFLNPSNQPIKAKRSNVGQNCSTSQFLRSQINQDQALKSAFTTTLEVATYYSVIEAARNHSIVVLQTCWEVRPSISDGSYLEVRICLETEASNTSLDCYNAEWYTFQLDVGQGFKGQRRTSVNLQAESTSDFFALLQSSGMKVLLLIDSDPTSTDTQIDGNNQGQALTKTRSFRGGQDRTYPVHCCRHLKFYLVTVKSSGTQLCKFVAEFLKGLNNRHSDSVEMILTNIIENSGLSSVQMWTPETGAFSFVRAERSGQNAGPASESAIGFEQTILKTVYTSPVFSSILAEILRRIDKPYTCPTRLYFEEEAIHIDVFALWSKQYEEHAVEVINIFGGMGDSSLSLIAEELAQYLFFRPRLSPIVSKASNSANAKDFIFQLRDDCSEQEVQAIIENELDPSEEPRRKIMLIDARRLKPHVLKQIFSFPSEVLTRAKEQNLRLIIFHAEERIQPDLQSCMHSARTFHQFIHTKKTYDRGELQSILIKNAGAKRITSDLKAGTSDPILDHYFMRTSGRMDAIEAEALIQYVLDFTSLDQSQAIGNCASAISVVSGDSHSHESDFIVNGFINLRKEVFSDETPDDSQDIKLQLKRVILNLNKQRDAGHLINSGTSSQILRIVSLLEKPHVEYLAASLSQSTDVSLDSFLQTLFNVLDPDLQQALVFFSILPEGISLENQILELNGDTAEDHDSGPTAGTGINRASFWKDCWLSALILETSETGSFHRLGGRFPGLDRPELLLFQWLHTAGYRRPPSDDQRSASSLLLRLVRQGFATTDGDTYMVTSTFRRFCEQRFVLHCRESCRYLAFVKRRELQIVDRLLELSCHQRDVEDCRAMLAKHDTIWKWVMDRMTSEKARTEETCIKAARLLWAVRRGVRAFYEAGEEETEADAHRLGAARARERNWLELLKIWAGPTASYLRCAADSLGSEEGSKACSRASALVAAAMCWFIEAHASRGRDHGRTLVCCSLAHDAVTDAGRLLSATGPGGGDTWECDVCSVEVLALYGRVRSEASRLPEEGKDRASETREESMGMLKQADLRIQELIKVLDSHNSGRGEARHGLTILRCEVLNALGNLCIRTKRYGEAQQYFEEAMATAGLKPDNPSFYSHNIGRARVEEYEAKTQASRTGRGKGGTGKGCARAGQVSAEPADSEIAQLLSKAEKDLRQALLVRKRAAHSKSFQTVLRLCDTHRTLHRALSLARGAPQAAADKVGEGELHTDRLAALGMLRRSARTWDDRAAALMRIGDWMRYLGLFRVPTHPQNGRYRVDVMWQLSPEDDAPPSQPRSWVSALVENPAFFCLAGVTAGADAGTCRMAELGGEMLWALTGLRLDSLAQDTAPDGPDLLLAADPAANALCEMVAECAAGRLPASRLLVAVAALRSLVRGRDGRARLRDRQWRSLVAGSLRAFVATTVAAALAGALSPTAASSKKPANDDDEGAGMASVEPAYVHRPAAYVARLLHLRRDDLPADAQRDVLRTALAAAQAYAAVRSWPRPGGGAVSHGDHNAGGDACRAYREVLLAWLAATVEPVGLRRP